MKKIICIGDSLALPGHKNSYEDTWIAQLKKKYKDIDFITFFKRGITTDALVSMGGGVDGLDNMPKGADCLEFFMPNVVVLQLGIVDCAPRLFKKGSLEFKLVQKAPSSIRTNYISLIKNIRKRNVNRVEISPEKFYYNLNNYFQRCLENAVEKLIVILIPYPDERMVKKNIEIISQVIKYNNIYLELSHKYNFVEICSPLDSKKYDIEIFEDGYHPNHSGHDLVYLAIVGLLEKCLNS